MNVSRGVQELEELGLVETRKRAEALWSAPIMIPGHFIIKLLHI